ncbi:DNA-dependent ATPase protein rad54 [Dispira simplex]|nr:DNA-dependent ATPase protein rad54 [Dispira simplex]
MSLSDSDGDFELVISTRSRLPQKESTIGQRKSITKRDVISISSEDEVGPIIPAESMTARTSPNKKIKGTTTLGITRRIELNHSRKPFRSPLLSQPPVIDKGVVRSDNDTTRLSGVAMTTMVNGIYCSSSIKTQTSIRKPFRTPFIKPPEEMANGNGTGVTGQDGITQGLLSGRPVKRLLGVRRHATLSNRPLHDPTAEGAIILYEPPQLSETEKLHLNPAARRAPLKLTINRPLSDKPSTENTPPVANTPLNSARPKVHVVVDPILSKMLRPHQVEGVKFLYNCVTGQIVDNAYGCIMADEMGLGKTLQCITLLWTLLRQSPNPGKPWIEKCIVVCPSSLVRNWANELVKWLGSVRINPYACDNKGTREKVTRDLRNFITTRGRMNIHPVLIISYETLRTHIDTLKSGPVGLLLCDEGHRLKNANSQTFQALNMLQVQRRVILSGTPIQNDLTEYFSLLNFANPGLLGSSSEFRRNYEAPILRGRDSCASEKERLISDQKLGELSALASKFIIRRTNDLLSKYLPVKYEQVVFCRLTSVQAQLYDLFSRSGSVKSVLAGNGCQSLRAIMVLKKLCNHPGLLNLPADIPGANDIWNNALKAGSSTEPGGGQTARRRTPTAGAHPEWDPGLSGKMLLLSRMLKYIKEHTKDKIVLISNYTQTLDVFEHLCRTRCYGCIRLDGSMGTAKRQQLVDRFNNPQNPEFVFLLSSKAGGCGINLIGANRLILFDPDWNPAADQQALARVWRDGQRKECFIYRFMGTGTIEEKIFQRQSHKQSLSSCVVDEEQDVERHFSREQLRQLFFYDPETRSDTHSTFRCRRCIKDRQFTPAAEPMSYGDTSTWNHYSDLELHKAEDVVLKKCAGDLVSYVFQYKSHHVA